MLAVVIISYFLQTPMYFCLTHMLILQPIEVGKTNTYRVKFILDTYIQHKSYHLQLSDMFLPPDVLFVLWIQSGHEVVGVHDHMDKWVDEAHKGIVTSYKTMSSFVDFKQKINLECTNNGRLIKVVLIRGICNKKSWIIQHLKVCA